MDPLKQVKMLLGIADADTDKDDLLTYVGNVVTVEVKGYCRVAVISDELQSVITDMVVDRYRARGYGQQDTPQTVSSITEGNVTVQLKTALSNATMELTDAEKKRLTPFRKLWS